MALAWRSMCGVTRFLIPDLATALSRTLFIPVYVIGEPSSKLSIKATGSVGYYQVNWDVWDGYENLNLSTSLPSGTNTTYSGSAPGVTMGMGIEYPTNLFGMVFGFDFRYLYLNFNNVGWYNSLDQEIIATWDFTEDSRVNLGLSGFRGRLELKRFFSW